MSELDVIVIFITDPSVWILSSYLKHTYLSVTVAPKYGSGSMPSCTVFSADVFGIFGFNNMPKDHYIVVKLAGALDQKWIKSFSI